MSFQEEVRITGKLAALSHVEGEFVTVLLLEISSNNVIFIIRIMSSSVDIMRTITI